MAVKIKMKLGEMLTEAGLLTEQQLKDALAITPVGMKLGQYLLQQGLINENQLMDVLARKLNIERYVSEKHGLDSRLSNLIPADFSQRHKVVPVRQKGKLLSIAMTDPLDIIVLDDIEAMADVEVDPLICTETQLSHLYKSVYGQYSDLAEVMEDVEEEAAVSAKESPSPSGTADIEVSTLMVMAEEAPIVRLVNSLIAKAIREKASDLHISPKKHSARARLRVDGKLVEMPALLKSAFLPLVSRLKIMANMDISLSRVPQDGRFTLQSNDREINVRVSTVPTIYGEKIVLRLLDMNAGISTLDQLGMHPADMTRIESLMNKPHGMILSTGPTGSGKSTLLYSIINKLNHSGINIITLEDPVEYRMENVEQIQLNRKAGMTFANGLRSVLRQDPDVIMVGEIRDAETAGIAVQAALTGHLVLSTVHTNDAAGAITRLLDMGVEYFLLSSVLLASVAQRLVRTICPYCSQADRPEQEVLKYWGLDNMDDTNFQRGAGCYACMHTGYRGRTGVFELLVVDEAVQEMIVQRHPAQEIAKVLRQVGKLRTLQDDAVRKVKQGMTTFDEITRVVASPELGQDESVRTPIQHTRGLESPDAKIQLPQASQPGAVQSPAPLERILVVDDDEAIREYIKTVLEAEYYEVEVASDGKQAMEKVLRHPPDMIIVDYYMPQMNGLEFLQKLKSHARLRHIPTIMLTASEIDQTEVQALDMGAEDWIQKPVRSASLLARIKRLLAV